MDLTDSVLDKWENGGIDLTKPFLIELEGSLTKDGKLDPAGSKFVRGEGDEDIVALAKSALEAVSDSGWFGYLSALEVKDFKLIMAQDGTNFSVSLSSDFETKERVRTAASGIQGILSLVKTQNAKIGADERLILENISVSSEESVLKINAVIPSVDLNDMITRNLRRASEQRR